MDYVVFGLGFGATLLVLGLVIRDVGPRVRYRQPGDPDGVFHAEELVARVSWERFCGALGTILAVAGLVFVIVTAICMVARTSDGTAGWVMIGSVALLCVLMAVWTWAFFDRFGAYGILPERGEQLTATTTSDEPQATTATARNEQVIEPAVTPAQQDAERVERAVVEGEASEAPAAGADAPPLKTPEELIADASDMDHESIDQELDIPVDVPDRPRRHGLAPDGSSPSQGSDNDEADRADAENTGTRSSNVSTNQDTAT